MTNHKILSEDQNIRTVNTQDLADDQFFTPEQRELNFMSVRSLLITFQRHRRAQHSASAAEEKKMISFQKDCFCDLRVLADDLCEKLNVCRIMMEISNVVQYVCVHMHVFLVRMICNFTIGCAHEIRIGSPLGIVVPTNPLQLFKQSN